MRRKITIMLMILSLSLISVGAFAYWASKISDAKKNKGVIIGIRKGEEVETTVNINDNLGDDLLLVPFGYEEENLSINEKNIILTLKWEGKGITGERGFYRIEFVEARVDGVKSEIASNLLTINYDRDDESITGNEAKEVILTVSFKDEPKNHEEYIALMGKKIDIIISVKMSPRWSFD